MIQVAGAEFQVNTTTPREQEDPAIAAFGEDGRYVVVWRDNSSAPDEPSITVRGQIYAADGSKIGGEFVVPFNTPGLQITPSVTALGDGFIVSFGTSFGSAGIAAQRFGPSGERLGEEFWLRQNNPSAQNGYSNGELVTLKDGGFALVYDQVLNAQYSQASIATQRFNAAGQPIGPSFVVHEFRGEEPRDFDVSELNGSAGGYVVVWSDKLRNTLEPEGAGVFARVFRSDGQPLGGQFTVNTNTAGDQSAPAVVGLADGGWVVVWGSHFDEAGVERDYVVGQRFAANGSRVGGEFIVVTAQVFDDFAYTEVEALPGGGWVVTWTTNDNSGSGVGLQEYDAAGQKVGNAYLANTQQFYDQSRSQLAATEEGLLVVWQGYLFTAPDPDSYTLRGQRYALPFTPPNPTPGDDVLRGSQSADTISGLAGNDAIEGRGGDDVLNGDAGADTLTGGAGSDTLRGGLGTDTLDGGAGADTVDYRDKTGLQPVVLSFSSTGTTTAFVAGVAEDTVIGVESVQGGAGSDRFTGDALGNAMFGNAGNDMLKGGGGTDYIYGGAGIDQADYSDFTVGVAVTLGAGTTVVRREGGAVEDYLREIEIIYGGAGNDVLTGDGGDNLFRGGGGADRIDGGGGRDSVDFRDMTGAVRLTLAGASFATATVGGVAADQVKNVELVFGGSAGDVLLGDGLANELYGGAGPDTLRGGGGADRLDGGAGTDQFVWGSVAESGPSAADTVAGFVSGADRLNLSLIDANTGAAGDQAFTLGVLQAGVAGRLQVTADGAGRWLVQGDVNGDGVPDLAILVLGATAPGTAAGDFAL